MKYKFIYRFFILLILLLLLGLNTWQNIFINDLKFQLRNSLTDNELFLQSFKFNLSQPIIKSPEFLRDSIFKSKLLYFYNINSCSSCDSVFEYLANIKDSIASNRIILIVNNTDGARGLKLLDSKIKSNIKVIDIPQHQYFIKHSFLCYNDSESKIHNQFITVPYHPKLVKTYLNYYRIEK